MDDTVIVADSHGDLQNLLNVYGQYCHQWKLTINTTKTKVMVFSSGRHMNYKFKLQDSPLEVVSEYKYLGILFSRSGSFSSRKKHMAMQATPVMYNLIKNSNHRDLPIDICIDLFNKTIKPTLLYGANIQGFENLDVIEKVQLTYLKHVLKLKAQLHGVW